jgi:hypothetical protein
VKVRDSMWGVQRRQITLAVLQGIAVGVYHGWMSGAAWATILFSIKQPFVLWSHYRDYRVVNRSRRAKRLRSLWDDESAPFEISLTIAVLFGLQSGWVTGGGVGLAFFLAAQPPILWNYFRFSK